MCDECDMGNHEECLDIEEEETMVQGPNGTPWPSKIQVCCCGYQVTSLPEGRS